MISVLIADQQEIAREGIKAVLEAYPGFKLAGEIRQLNEIDISMEQLNVDVLIIDFIASERNSVALLRHIRHRYPKVGILVLTNDTDLTRARRAISSGVLGYLSKKAEPLSLATAIRLVAAGRPCIDSDIADHLVSEFCQSNCTGTLHRSLSAREFEVFLALARGETYPSIARSLDLSVKTVATHKSSIFVKLQVSTMSSLIQYAICNHLLPGYDGGWNS